MFEISATPVWFESLRVPVAQGGDAQGRARWSPGDRSLGWLPSAPGGRLQCYSLGSIPIHVSRLAAGPPSWGSSWEPCEALSRDGVEVAHVWRCESGVYLPFDPDEAILAFLSESYLAADAVRLTIKGTLRKAYYRARPLLPRAVQLPLRRAFSRIQRRQRFPRWPIETALHDLYARLLEVIAEVAGEPVPWIGPWPQPFSWALVLTHDVETSIGYANIPRVCELERTLGYRSSWNLVPRRDYTVEDDLVEELRGSGWEVGVHGLRHDGRDLESAQRLSERLPEMRDWAERWGATGFRSPATQRRWGLMPTLGFEYDSSYPDTDPYEPQGGGCCSWLPFFNGELVELPITLAQDHTLFVILRERGARLWLEKVRFLRERGGMALLNTHPDYLVDERAWAAYEVFLRALADDGSAWKVLPRELASWWRRRAATRIERDGSAWRLAGPGAAEASLAFQMPQAA